MYWDVHCSISLCLVCRSQAFLAELNKRDSEAVLKHVEDKTLAVNSAVIVEYLKALVKTNRISQYSNDGIVGYVAPYGHHSTLVKCTAALQ